MFVVHVGPHKTATTWLQANFHASHKTLREHGWLYPLIGERVRIAHHDLSDLPALILDPKSRPAREIKQLAQDATAKGHNVLLSSEGFRKWRPKHLKALAKLVAPHELHIVYVIRDPLDVLQSFWAQRVKTGQKASLPDMVAKNLRAARRSKVINPLKELTRYSKLEGVRLTILSYEEIRRRELDIFDVFATEVLGLDPLPKIADHRGNPREPLELTEFMRLLLTRFANWKGRGQVHVGRAFRHLLTPATQKKVLAAVENVPSARRSFTVDRSDPKLVAIEARINARFGDIIRPTVKDGKVFGEGPATFHHLDEETLKADPAVARLLDDLAHAFRPSGPRMLVANLSREALIAWRRVLKRFR